MQPVRVVRRSSTVEERNRPTTIRPVNATAASIRPNRSSAALTNVSALPGAARSRTPSTVATVGLRRNDDRSCSPLDRLVAQATTIVRPAIRHSDLQPRADLTVTPGHQARFGLGDGSGLVEGHETVEVTTVQVGGERFHESFGRELIDDVVLMVAFDNPEPRL
jgi:hypothetical protein